MAILALLSGCSEVDSKDLKTSGIYTETAISANDESTTVSVRMRLGRALDADTIILSAGDQLSASMSGNTIGLFRTESDAYRGTFDNSPGGATVTVSLSRADDSDAPNSVTTLPNVFEIDAPSTGETFNAGENITVIWTPTEPNNTAIVSYQLNCTVYDANGIPSGANYGRGYTVVDNGSHTTSINEVLNVFGSQDELVKGASCPFEVTVTRTEKGALDPALVKGGEITATREKTVIVNVVP